MLETYVSYLRKKLNPYGPQLIHTVRGVGYALRAVEGLSVSLRARLLLGMLALTALGLLVAGAVTYAEQKSFLLDRIDQQARAALPSVSRQLDEKRRERSRLRRASAASIASRRPGGPGHGPPKAGSTCPRAPTASAGTRAARCSETWSSPTGRSFPPCRASRRTSSQGR